VTEALETALKFGQGKVNVYQEDGKVFRYSSDLHCAECDIHYAEPTPAMFSFNSPLGACDTCRGFGRVIGVDYGLVIPDASKTLREGAVRVKRADGHKHFNLRGHHVVVLGHGPQTLSATSLSLVLKQLEQAGYSREQLRREWA